VDARADAMLKQMTQTEKLTMVMGGDGAVKLHVQSRRTA
jgi:hypothetical protein